MNDKVTGSPGSLDAPWCIWARSFALRKGYESTAVRFGRQFGTHPEICVATFFTEFRVDANYDITT